MSLTRNRTFGLALAALILIADQAVKWWVTAAGLARSGRSDRHQFDFQPDPH